MINRGSRSPGKKRGRDVCPILSTPARVNEKGIRTEAGLVQCLGFDCSLYRSGHEMCSFLGMPDIIDQVSAVGSRSVDALDQAREALAGSNNEAGEAIEEWRRTLAGIRAMFEETRQGMERGSEEASEGMKALLTNYHQAHSQQEDMLHNMEEVLHRLDQENRLRQADAAARDGGARFNRGEFRDALSRLEKALGITGGGAALFNILGCVYLRLDRLDDAGRSFELAIERDPACGAAHINLGAALLRSGESERAEEELETGLRLDPASGPGWNTLGNLFFITGRRLEAVEQWERAVSADPGQFEAWENLRRQHQLENCPFPTLLEEARRQDAARQIDKSDQSGPAH